MRERPSDVGLAPYGSADARPPAPTVHSGSVFATPFRVLGQAVRVRDFWLLAGTFFVCGWTTNGAVQSHFIPAVHDHGIPQVTAASLLAVIGVFDIVGATASGWLTDRTDPRRLLFLYYCLRGTSLAALPFLLQGSQLPLVAFAIVYGLDWVATVPPTIALTNQAFGREQASVVFGWVFCAHMMGGAMAAWLAGTFREAFGDYLIASTAAGFLALLAGFAALGIARGSRPRYA
jgi:predicted MFS family arabinose efflux permease